MSTGTVVPLIGAVGAIGLGAAAVYFSSNAAGRGDYMKIEPVVDLGNQTVIIPVRKFILGCL